MTEKRTVPITELFTDDFISRCSKYKSLQEMIKVSGHEILTPPFQIFCTYMTDFHSWDDMLKAAKAEYIQRKQIINKDSS